MKIDGYSWNPHVFSSSFSGQSQICTLEINPFHISDPMFLQHQTNSSKIVQHFCTVECYPGYLDLRPVGFYPWSSFCHFFFCVKQTLLYFNCQERARPFQVHYPLPHPVSCGNSNCCSIMLVGYCGNTLAVLCLISLTQNNCTQSQDNMELQQLLMSLV